MKYAVLNGERIEPQKGIKDAICPICGEIVVPKCGQIKIHHWAHQSTINCDPWWESETEWHRKWKDNFSKECQEVIMHDKKTGEKHVADIKTQSGIVIEFQHSPMNIKEQSSREQFYKNMVWVVDARKYYDKFKQNINLLEHCKSNKNYFYIKIDSFESQKNCFPQRWLESSVPVIFDFGINGDVENIDYNKQKKWLWCIFPEKFTKNLGYWFDETICGMYLKKETFINRVLNYDSFYQNIVIPELEELKKKIEQKIKNGKEEDKWIYAIHNVRLNIKNNNIQLKKLDISHKGEILDSNNRNYNNYKCLVLGVKSYISTYNGNECIKYNALLLIKMGKEFIIATIDIFSQNSTIDLNNNLFSENYGITIKTLSTYHLFGDKYIAWFEDDKGIWTTEKLKKDLEFICNNFK